jgi:hypothetical protein
MALYVVLASTNIKGKHNSIECHIGFEPPKLTNEEVIEIQADYDELDYIVQYIQGIPLAWHKDTIQGTTGRTLKVVQRWFGDHAKFIFHNLKW